MRQREIDSGRLRLAVHHGLVSPAFSRFVSDCHSVAPNVNLQVSVKGGAVNMYDSQFDMAILPARLVEHQGVIWRTLYHAASVLVEYLGVGSSCAAALCTSCWLARPPGERQHAVLLPRTKLGWSFFGLG
jgi:DNA-binding transcriptional LysR family regulator